MPNNNTSPKKFESKQKKEQTTKRQVIKLCQKRSSIPPIFVHFLSSFFFFLINSSLDLCLSYKFNGKFEKKKYKRSWMGKGKIFFVFWLKIELLSVELCQKVLLLKSC
jgi:hypothetical protein